MSNGRQSKKIEVTLTDVDGHTSKKKLDRGATLSALVGKDQIGLINDEKAALDSTLRDGDNVEAIRKSGKQGK